MPRELITIQVGQCGNQIGRQFWSMALEEHAKYTNNGLFDESLSSFFRNVDSRYEDPVDLPFLNGQNEIRCLKARAILVDMEEGPVAETLTGPLGELFDSRQFITDVSGSGNNWAHGHAVYGPKYQEDLLDKLHRATEMCDSLQSFFLLHSLGGGTGSGLGTYITGILEDYYPDIYRFVTAVFPSSDDDVITSPYNSVLALRELTEHADCVLPIENQALMDMCLKMNPEKGSRGASHDAMVEGSRLSDGGKTRRLMAGQKPIQAPIKGAKPKASSAATAFTDMNNIVAHLLTSLTSSMRFEGSLNIDLNEITTNLVPYPKLHYIMSSMSPLFAIKDPRKQPRRLDQMFTDVFQSDHQLIQSNPRSGTTLACGLLVRGNVEVSDISSNIQRIQKELKMIYWNEEGFKVGVCSRPPVGLPYSLLCLSNNCCIKDTFTSMRGRFQKLYRRKAHMHHYTEYIDAGGFDTALESLEYLISEYTQLDEATPPSETKSMQQRLTPLF